MQFFLFIAVVILIILGVITVQNPNIEIAVKFIKWDFSGPVALVLAVPFVAGIIASMFMFIPPWMKKASLARTHKKRIQELELEIANASEEIDTADEPEGEQRRNGEENQQ